MKKYVWYVETAFRRGFRINLRGGQRSHEFGWKCPSQALSFPAFMLINAFFFHFLPVLITGKVSPGLITGMILFIPIGLLNYYGIFCDQVLLLKVIWLAAVIMAYPIILQRLKQKKDFPAGSVDGMVASSCPAENDPVGF